MSLKSGILVALQMASILYLLLTNMAVLSGLQLVIQCLGGLIAFWGIATIKLGNFNIQPEVKSETLITKGPYKVIRNPMYTGLILIFLPIITIHFSVLNILAFLVLLVTLLLKIFSEEQFLEQHFGREYLNYKKKTFRLIPYIY